MSIATKLFVVIAASLCCLKTEASTLLSIPPDSNTPVCCIVETATGTALRSYGQTFRVPDYDSQDLRSIAIYIAGTDLGVRESVIIYPWDELNSRPIFRALTGMGPFPTPVPFGSTYRYELNGVYSMLNPGQTYVLVVTTAGFPGLTSGRIALAANAANPYADGQFVYLEGPNDINSIFDRSWSTDQTTYDLAIELGFGLVPEPGTFALLGVGSTALYAVRRIRTSRR